MRYVKLGRTGVDVSAVCLGTMSFGTPAPGPQQWKLDEDDARPLVKEALEAGINFFDTANMYSGGVSEEITGRALRDFARRDEIVLATKVFGTMREGPNGGGLSRKSIMHEIDASLRRLGTDYVDLYQIHRWDPATPIEETLDALNDVVRAGKARYLGASSMYAWQLSKALHTSERHGWASFVTMQNLYNLLYREEEREVLPLCLDAGLGSIPWSPLATGKLVRPWGRDSRRADVDAFGNQMFIASDRGIVESTLGLAQRLAVPPAQVALAWVMRHPAVTAPIVGVTKPGQLRDAVAAVDLRLSDDDAAALESQYLPHPVYGHR